MAEAPAPALGALLADAERTQLQLLGAIPDRPERVAQLKDAVLFLLDVLVQVEWPDEQRETLAALQRVFSPCAAYLYDVRAFLDDAAGSSASGMLMSPRQGAKRGNVVLKALLGAITALSSRSTFPADIVRGLVDMVRELCAQSINSADVVMLFDFLRLGQPPVRSWLLQAQRSLVELQPMPRAIFAMQGDHAGIIAPSHQALLTKKGYTCSFGIRLDPGSPPMVSLYSFRGQNGHGVSALLDGNTLVIKTHSGQSACQQVDVPFTECRAKMENAWVHFCVVHAKKMVFKDKVTVFVNGKPVFNGGLAYPDPLNLAGGQNSVGIIPSTPGVQGKLWSPTLFGLPLSEAEVQKLHWLTHWKSDLSSVAAENAGQTDKSRFVFSYDARNCDLDRRICHDVSGNECHGWLEPGTRTYVTQNFVQALDSIGGCACFLLLLLDQIPEMADFHPKTEFRMEEISDLLGFVGTALRCSIECRAHFVRLQGVKVVEFVLLSMSPSYLSINLLDSIVGIIEALVGTFERDIALLSDLIHRLLFFNPNWFLSPFETQVKLLDEVLPKYLQLLQDKKTRHRSTNAGTVTADATAQSATWLSSFDPVEDVDVDFFCNLIVQVYLVRESSDGEQVTTAQMDVYQLKYLRTFIMHNLIGRLLASSSMTDSKTLGDNWEQLFAHICRRSGNGSNISSGCVDVEEMLSYLTQILNSEPPRGGAQSPAPLTRQQLTSAICKVSKGTLRLFWRPMLSAVDSVRMAALRFFESYTSDKVLLRRRDVLMLGSALQAHVLTSQATELLLNIVIGRRLIDQGSRGTVVGGELLASRAVGLTRLELIPQLLLGLIHNAESKTQMQILAEIKLLLLSPTVSDSVKEAIRSWPPWLSRLQAIAFRAIEHQQVALNPNTPVALSMTANYEDEAHILNEACIALSDNSASVDSKLEALETIAASGDIRGCDFALSVLQNNIQHPKHAEVARAIMGMVLDKFPQHSPVVVTKLANQLIVDVVVYSILNVRNGWMHVLELFYYHCKRPSELCSLVAAVCEQTLQRLLLRSTPVGNLESTTWENLSQVAAIISQSGAMATVVDITMGSHEAALSIAQQQILARQAFEVWLVVVPHLDEIKWGDMKAHLELNTDYGADIPAEEKQMFCNLVSTDTQARALALQCALKHLRHADFSSQESAWGLCNSFARLLAHLDLLPASHFGTIPVSGLPLSRATSSATSAPSSRSSSHISNASGSGIGDLLSLSGAIESSDSMVNERFRAHVAALDSSFAALDKQFKVESASPDTIRLVVRVMVALSVSALQMCDNESADELVKALQIIASTDVEFFSDITQIQELASLWRIHWDSQYANSGARMESPAASSSSEFLNRWAYIMEHHSLEFNPFLIQKHATSQAETLGNELYASEEVWKEILDRSEAAAAAKQSREEGDDEPRLVQLKLDVDKFASSIHKLITRSSVQNASLRIEEDPGSLFGQLHGSGEAFQAIESPLAHDETKMADEMSTDMGPLLKVSSRENGFRMRLRLKEVPLNYRIRNLSCECAGSGFLDTESRGSGKVLGRRLRASLDRNGGDLEKSWRSDADSDYSDFLADAQMRAAIIRSSSNADAQGSPLSDGFSDDELDGVDVDAQDELERELQNHDYTRDFYDQEAETTPSEAARAEISAELPRTVDNFVAEPISSLESSDAATSDGSVAPSNSVPTSVSQPIPIPVGGAPSPPVSSAPASAASSLKSIASSPYSFGASVLSAVGGMAGFVHKAAKDAKDAVEYGVDSLYTAKDALSEEAQTLIQEVSTIMDNNVASSSPGSSSTTAADAEIVASLSAANGRASNAGAQSDNLSSSPKDRVSSLTPSQLEKLATSSRPPLTPTSTIASAQRSKREMQFRAKLVRHMHVVEGRLLLSDTQFGFIAERVVDEHDVVVVERNGSAPIDKPWRFLFKNRRWRIDDISGLHRRRYLLKPTALEIFIQLTRKNYFFNFAADDVALFHEALMARRPLLLKRDPTLRRLRHPSSIFRNSNMSARWVNHEISTFEYLMWLNTIAGRTYNDLTQYPVFPWVIADYESATLDLSRRQTFRDLSKPMGALEPTRLKSFLDRYHAFDDPDIPKFMYGTHYSNIGVVLYYLIRLEPFTSYALTVQGGKFDHADRLFHCIAETWQNCLADFTDLKELTPEWFYLPEFLKNRNHLDLGVKQNGVPVGDVVLPPWAKSPEDFVLKNLLALESEYVSTHIHDWIDLVFGAKQRGPAAVAANNVFFYLTYEGMVDIDSIADPVIKASMRAQIAHFGQTPTQVLRDPHPVRHPSLQLPPSTPDESEDGLRVSEDRVQCVGTTQMLVPHDAPIVQVAMVPGSSTLVCLDSNGMVSTHRYGTKPTKVHHHYNQHQREQHHFQNSPFLNELSASATRATASVFKPSSNSSKASSTPMTSPTGSSAGWSSSTDQFPPSDFIELQDRKSHRALGDKRLLDNSADTHSLSRCVAFLSHGTVLCSVGHHDFSARFHSAADGSLLYRLLQHSSVVTCLGTSHHGSLLALGSADGSLSIWKVAHANSTLLDTIKLFKRNAIGAVAASSSSSSVSLPASPMASASKPVLGNDYAADQVLLGHRARVNCVAVSEELGVCVSGSVANECLAHSLDDGAILQQFDVGKCGVAPGVTAVALSSVGHVVAQSVSSGVPVLYSFHLNGTLLARLELPNSTPVTFMDVCARSSRVVISNGDTALSLSAFSLQDQQVLLDATASRREGERAAGNERITSQAVAPDERHVVFGVGVGKIVCVPLPPASTSSAQRSASPTTGC